jgi:hypothetical protein
MRDGGGLATLETSLHHTAFVAPAVLVTVLVAEVDFHPCDPFVESAQNVIHYIPNVGGKILSAFDIVVRIDLNLHLSSPLSLSAQCR